MGDLIMDVVRHCALQPAAQPRYSKGILADRERIVVRVYQAWRVSFCMKGLR
jgi:hypothetical protein